MAEISSPSFAAAHEKGLMGVACRTEAGGGITICSTGQRVTDWTRCRYLGLDRHPDVLAGAKRCLDEMGSTHFSVARTRLTAEPLAVLEDTLADLLRVPGVVVFPTVAAANMACLPLLAGGLFTGGQKPTIAVDRLAHVTLQYHIPVLREETDVVVIEHNDLGHLEELCRQGAVAYVGDGAYSMGGEAPVHELRRLQERYPLFIYLDDAHGISIAGRRGEGFVRSRLHELGPNTMIAASLGKGFGASGGLVMVGTDEQEEAIRRFAPTYVSMGA
jgi:7-keto-8-aminopelargonate synthetase-like enzyme